jgi:uncharacterized protein (DUF1330 family)
MHLKPTPESISSFLQRGISGPVTMLNLLRFREIADYSESPDLSPDEPITGERAYEIYTEHTLPLLSQVGAKPIFMGTGGEFLIGPADETWDRVLLVRYPDMQAFLAMTQNPEYEAGAGHRTAALADSRLLPIE